MSTSSKGSKANLGKVLITGCSTGIGRAAVKLCAAAGYEVLATARRVESIADLGKLPGVTLAALDVTKPEQCEQVVREAGEIYALVNNAGYGLMGPVEMLPEADLREQYEVNVFGLVRMTRLVLPAMRKRGSGRIVHVGSVVGKFSYPLGGAYCSTKHAVEALSDAMRAEVAPFGIKVVLIEPGPVATDFTKTVEKRGFLPGAEPGEPYEIFSEGTKKVMAPRGWPGAAPARVGRVVLRAIDSSHPRARYVVTMRGRVMILLRRMLPDFLWDAVALNALLKK